MHSREGQGTTEEVSRRRDDTGKQQGPGGEQGQLCGLLHRWEYTRPQPQEGRGGDKFPIAHNSEGAQGLDGTVQPVEPLGARSGGGTGGIQEAVEEECTIHCDRANGEGV